MEQTEKIPDTGIVVLAAGASTRMGQPKQLLPIQGEPLLRRMAMLAVRTCVKHVAVVLGSEENKLREPLSGIPVDIVINRFWENGMGSSIKAGVKHLLNINPKLYGIVIMVCDQPLLRSPHIDALVKSHLTTQKPIVASRYAHTTGVPVFFHQTCFKDLLNLQDTEGAKKILQRYHENTFAIDFPEGEIDLDTTQDYDTFIGKMHNL